MAITPEEFDAHRDAVTSQAPEVLDHMYQAILKVPEFTLRDGTKCTVSSYYNPETNADGELKCGFDAHMDNGTDLEFTVAQTGWGKSFAAARASKKSQPGCARQRALRPSRSEPQGEGACRATLSPRNCAGPSSDVLSAPSSARLSGRPRPKHLRPPFPCAYSTKPGQTGSCSSIAQPAPCSPATIASRCPHPSQRRRDRKPFPR